MLQTRFNILGVHVSAITMRDALDSFREWISSRQPHYVCVTPAHAVMECWDHPELRQVYNASGLTTPDGMAIVWLLRWAGHENVERVYGPDLLLATCQKSLKTGWRHYFYGGAPGVAEALVAALKKSMPELQVVGIDSPPFRRLTPEEDEAACARIRTSQADIVWVGLGSPKQEVWMSEHFQQLGVPVIVGVGAAFDFLSGVKLQAPRWMQRSGLEWFFRLLNEPGRLWRRYLLGYPRFVILVILQRLGVIKC